MLEAFLASTGIVALAEIGDRTQLLTLLLVAKYRKPWPILLGVLVATLANHGIASFVGQWVGNLLEGEWLRWVLGLSFLAMALWTLKPDDLDDDKAPATRFGVFLGTLVIFFIVEIGDKTQIATTALAARYDNVFYVTMGTTLGMMIANAPVAFFGDAIVKRLPLHVIRWIAAGLFAVFGILTLVSF